MQSLVGAGLELEVASFLFVIEACDVWQDVMVICCFFSVICCVSTLSYVPKKLSLFREVNFLTGKHGNLRMVSNLNERIRQQQNTQ
jgi:hypothetical protein